MGLTVTRTAVSLRRRSPPIISISVDMAYSYLSVQPATAPSKTLEDPLRRSHDRRVRLRALLQPGTRADDRPYLRSQPSALEDTAAHVPDDVLAARPRGMLDDLVREEHPSAIVVVRVSDTLPPSRLGKLPYLASAPATWSVTIVRMHFSQAQQFAMPSRPCARKWRDGTPAADRTSPATATLRRSSRRA